VCTARCDSASSTTPVMPPAPRCPPLRKAVEELAHRRAARPAPPPAGTGRAGPRRRPSPACAAALMANAIRALAMDGVQQARSGHPGAPMGMAEMAVALWSRHLRHNPADPHWADRDRFVLSNGHASMLLYALLHLSGYDLPMSPSCALPPAAQQDPGPPRGPRHARCRDHHRPAGPGPGQRGGHGAGREAAGRRVQPPGHTVVDHHTYVFLGDGCLMEGISHEACSLAGTLEAEQAGRAVRRQRHQHRRPCKAGSATTPPRASAPTAGTSSARSTATTSTR
jgi:transketolase